jgi:glutamyl-tRNA reductase
MILGEPQILGQVANAYSTALAHGAAAHTLSTLFHGAIRAGRRARSETAINHNPATVGSAAVKMVSETISDLGAATVVVLGAGAMAESALAALHHRGVRNVCVVSRTREHAEQLSTRFDGRSEALERLESVLTEADIVITAVAAPHHVIDRQTLGSVMHARPQRALIVVDIAVPRNVDPAAVSLPNLRYVDLDDLQRHVSDTLVERTLEVPRAAAIVEEEARACMTELLRLDARPLIADLRAYTEAVRRDTLVRAMRHFAHLPEADLARIEAFSESLANRLFHEPMARLRTEAEHGQCAGYAMAVRDLFMLNR